MKFLIPLIFFAVLIAIAVRMTRRQFQLDQFAAPPSLPPGGAGSLVAAPDASGAFQRVEEGIEEMRRTWHPVRFPSGWESRSGGLPEEKVYADATMIQRRDWCLAHCEEAWRVEVPPGNAPVFWFQSARDARDFTEAWFPFKCG